MGNSGEHETGPISTSEEPGQLDRQHRELLATIQHLHDAHEISSGLQSFFDQGFMLWVGDPLNGYYALREFAWTELTRARLWLVDTVQELECALRLLDDLANRPFEAARLKRIERERHGKL